MFFDITAKTRQMLEKTALCNRCLGQQFATLGFGIDNETRGEAIKLVLTMNGHGRALAGDKGGIKLLRTLSANGAFEIATNILRKLGARGRSGKPCFLCEERFRVIDKLVNQAVDLLEKYEFTTFLVGVELPVEVEEREDEFRAKHKLGYGESMRNAFSREIGKKITLVIEKNVDYRKPDIVILINPFTERTTLQMRPLYLKGRYRKLVRGIPQSRWFCKECRGQGCEKCGYTGEMYPESVESLISAEILNMVKGEKTVFHASGREDIDARMLGSGRPFIVEIKRPEKRFINLEKLEKQVNKYAEKKVEVLNLGFSERSDIRRLKKNEASRKLYRVKVSFDREVTNEELKELETKLTNLLVSQRTPERVLHRRANLTREKFVYEAQVKRVAPKLAEIKLLCQGGLYVKELVTGDGGRTSPSVKETLKVEATPLELDVLEVILRERP